VFSITWNEMGYSRSLKVPERLLGTLCEILVFNGIESFTVNKIK